MAIQPPTPLPAPPAPQGMPGMPTPPGQGDPNAQTGQDPMAMLMGGKSQLMDSVKSKLIGMDKQKASSDVRMTTMQRGVDELKQVVMDEFKKMLTDAGVDINDPNSIKQYVDKLGQINPDLVVFLESIFNVLKPQDQGVDMNSISSSRDLIKKFSQNAPQAGTPMETPTEQTGADQGNPNEGTTEQTGDTSQSAPPAPNQAPLDGNPLRGL